MKIKERLLEYFYTLSGKAPAKDWLNSVKDKLTQAILYKRIRQASLGNFGDHKSVGTGVFEMKIDYGPGFRIYYGIVDDEIILLLMGGSKRTQQGILKKQKPTGSYGRKTQMNKLTSFNDDFMQKLRDPEFASNYIMAAIVENDLDFLPTALGDVAKAYGMSKLAEGTGINRRTLYKVFDKDSNPSFELVTQIMTHLGLSLQVKPQPVKPKIKRKKSG